MRPAKALIAGAGLALLMVSSRSGASPDRLDAPTQTALRDALADERLAEATYAAVIARHGDVRPFRNIVRAERRHQQFLLELFDRYGIDVPERIDYDIEAPDTVAEACADGIAAEKRNIALYDAALKRVDNEDVRDVFIYLRDASKENHLPAFRRCVRRAPRRGPGR